jgi:hypothetical protein
MEWLSWLALAGVILAIFVAWDWMLCGGRYCRRFFE